MASPPTIDLETLLKPISEEAPAGMALRDDPAGSAAHYAVKDARTAASSAERAILKAADWDDADGPPPVIPKPDWQTVIRLASDILARQSKDLWVAAWLVEGLARRHGFAGLRDGFELVAGLCDQFWDGIHPRPDDDGVATTVSQLAGLNGEGSDGTLVSAIAAIPITQGTTEGPFTGHDYADASHKDMSDPEKRARRVAHGIATLEQIETAAKETSAEFFAELREDIAAAIEQFNRMNAILGEKCGKDGDGYSVAPPSSQISTALNSALERVKRLGGEPADVPHEQGVESGGAIATTGQTGVSLTSGNIFAREEAFQLLMKVADYFRRAEPHSPVSYALEQAVRWGRMPLPELMKELVSDESVRRELFRRTGMPADRDNE